MQTLSNTEQLVLEIIDSAHVLTMEQVIDRLPQLSWSQLFHAIDSLSRRGEIELRRRGFQYELASTVRRSSASPVEVI